jgi:hypothetical protein
MEYYSNVDAACEAVASSLNQKLDKTQTYKMKRVLMVVNVIQLIILEILISGL